jgi:hypothetical protein
MKKVIALLMLLVSLATANAKCDWSKTYLAKTNICRSYDFYVTGIVDSCFSGEMTIYKNGNSTPLYVFTTRRFKYSFKDTGRYTIKVRLVNGCSFCDTMFYVPIYVTCDPVTKPKCDWSKVTLTQQNVRNQYRFTLDGINLDDTCIDYVYIVYTVKNGQIDTMSSFKGVVDIIFTD